MSDEDLSSFVGVIFWFKKTYKSSALFVHTARVITGFTRDRNSRRQQVSQRKISETACKEHGSSGSFDLRIEPDNNRSTAPPKKVSSLFSTN